MHIRSLCLRITHLFSFLFIYLPCVQHQRPRERRCLFVLHVTCSWARRNERPRLFSSLTSHPPHRCCPCGNVALISHGSHPCPTEETFGWACGCVPPAEDAPNQPILHAAEARGKCREGGRKTLSHPTYCILVTLSLRLWPRFCSSFSLTHSCAHGENNPKQKSSLVVLTSITMASVCLAYLPDYLPYA